MRILVTGGAGFIGRQLVAELLSSGHEVVVLDNLRRADRNCVPDGAAFFEGDIRDRAAVHRAMDGCKRVFHLAAQSNVLGAVTDIEYSFTTNVVGTFHVLSCAVELDIEQVVFTSSREVYGEVNRVPVAEDQALAPKNAYGASKVAGEAYCRVFEATYGLQVNVLRLANVYGVGDHDRVIPIWLEKAYRGETLELFGGEQVLDFVSADLVVQALVRAGEKSLGGTPVNVGTGMGTVLRDLAATVQRLPGARVDVRVLPARPVEVTRFVADVTRMRDVLKIQPPVEPLADLSTIWRLSRTASLLDTDRT